MVLVHFLNRSTRANGNLNKFSSYNVADAKSRRSSLFSFQLDFGAELESTQETIKAKEEALKAPPVRSIAVREHQLSVAEHVVNDEEQWKKFREQMRSGGAKTGMQLKHSLDGLLQTRAHDLETTGAVAARVDNNRRASLTDFATSLIRGDDRHNRRSSTYASFPPLNEEFKKRPGNTAQIPGNSHDSTASTDVSSIYTQTKRIADYLIEGD